jgi:hypothetical protein
VRGDATTWDDVLEYWRPLPAVLYDRRLDVLAATTAARRLSGAFHVGENLARFAFLSPESRPSHPRWPQAASATAGLLRAFVDERDEDRRSQRIVGELSTGSRDFATIWANTDTATPLSGAVTFEVAPVGDIPCTYSVLGVADYEDLAVLVFVPSGDSGRVALERLLASSSASD